MGGVLTTATSPKHRDHDLSSGPQYRCNEPLPADKRVGERVVPPASNGSATGANQQADCVSDTLTRPRNALRPQEHRIRITARYSGRSLGRGGSHREALSL